MADLRLRIPIAEKPARLDTRWTAEDCTTFLRLGGQFVQETEFAAFVAEHEQLYKVTAERLTRQLAAHAYLAWFDKFFGVRPAAQFEALVGLLNGGGCYGVGVRFADGREEITPVLGAWRFDSTGVPEFDDSIDGAIVHELCHSYTNPLVDQFATALTPAAERIYAHCAGENAAAGLQRGKLKGRTLDEYAKH